MERKRMIPNWMRATGREIQEFWDKKKRAVARMRATLRERMRLRAGQVNQSTTDIRYMKGSVPPQPDASSTTESSDSSGRESPPVIEFLLFDDDDDIDLPYLSCEEDEESQPTPPVRTCSLSSETPSVKKEEPEIARCFKTIFPVGSPCEQHLKSILERGAEEVSPATIKAESAIEFDEIHDDISSEEKVEVEKPPRVISFIYKQRDISSTESISVCENEKFSLNMKAEKEYEPLGKYTPYVEFHQEFGSYYDIHSSDYRKERIVEQTEGPDPETADFEESLKEFIEKTVVSSTSLGDLMEGRTQIGDSELEHLPGFEEYVLLPPVRTRSLLFEPPSVKEEEPEIARCYKKILPVVSPGEQHLKSIIKRGERKVSPAIMKAKSLFEIGEIHDNISSQEKVMVKKPPRNISFLHKPRNIRSAESISVCKNEKFSSNINAEKGYEYSKKYTPYVDFPQKSSSYHDKGIGSSDCRKEQEVKQTEEPEPETVDAFKESLKEIIEKTMKSSTSLGDLMKEITQIGDSELAHLPAFDELALTVQGGANLKEEPKREKKHCSML